MFKKMSKPDLKLVASCLFFLLGAFGFITAQVPPAGTVVEGVAVPGIAVGQNRGAVMAVYGQADFCQGPTQSLCSYLIDAGQVDVRYYAAGGGEALGTPEDVVHTISWHRLEDWVTTAGVNTALALTDPEAVIAAYPEAEVTYNIQGNVYSIIDYRQGIRVVRNTNFYSGTVTVSISIMSPGEPPAATASSAPTLTPSPAPTPAPTTLPPFLLGDVNGDGSIGIVDALLIAQYYVGEVPGEFNPAAADTNCDGSITIVDSLLVARYVVGIVSAFCL